MKYMYCNKSEIWDTWLAHSSLYVSSSVRYINLHVSGMVRPLNEQPTQFIHFSKSDKKGIHVYVFMCHVGLIEILKF